MANETAHEVMTEQEAALRVVAEQVVVPLGKKKEGRNAIRAARGRGRGLGRGNPARAPADQPPTHPNITALLNVMQQRLKAQETKLQGLRN